MVGGGVIGLACAWRLLRCGIPVSLVDPGDPAEGATWAAGGMLAPLGEAPEPGPFLAFALRSLAAYPDFAAELEAVARTEVGLRLNGKLLTASGPEERARLRARHGWLLGDGHPVRWLEGDQVRELEPSVSPAVEAGLLLEGNGRVDPRRLHAALSRAVDTGGVARVRSRAEALELEGERVRALRCADGVRVPADVVVLSAGAWAGGIGGLPRAIPVRPVKGQMLALSAPERPLSRVVISSSTYLIPREGDPGPLVVVGATTEHTGFDRSLSAPGQEWLEEGARRLVPSLASAPVVERWAGLRPGTPDGLPVLGPDPDVPGLIYATGHYRNGILLAPATAEAVETWVSSLVGSDGARRPRGTDVKPAPRAFSPARRPTG